MKRLWILIAMLLAFVSSMPVSAEDYVFGVLNKRSKDVFFERWVMHCHYLGEQTPFNWKVVPLGFDEVDAAVKNKTVDFVVVNSSMYATLEHKYGIKAIATMVNNSSLGVATDQFGGVIFTAAASPGMTGSLDDVRGKRLFAVSDNSFGGYQMAVKELLDHGINVERDMAGVTFTKSHDEVVKQVLANPGSIGTVRTDTLERMNFEGKANIDSVRVLGKKSYANFPFVVSTKLYPEWPMAKLPHIPASAANTVAAALKKISADNYAAKAAHLQGWADPRDYRPVTSLLISLGLLPSASPMPDTGGL